MSRQTEKLLKEVNAFLDVHGGEFNSNEEMNALLRQFMEEKNAQIPIGAANSGPETADDYLELAEEAASKKKQMEYLDKALALEPDNLDAGRMKAELTTKHLYDLLEELSLWLEKGNQQMKKEGFFDEDCKGHFWGIIETRPYMRLRHAYMRTLTACGMLHRAARECEEMLTLCEGDNLGVRYDLMHLYAMLEEEAPAKALMEKYPGDETQMLLPLSILHFKLGQMDEALEVLKHLNRLNKDTGKFLKTMMSGDSDELLMAMRNPYGYQANCIEELAIEATLYTYLFENAVIYFDWAYQALKEAKKAKAKKTAEK